MSDILGKIVATVNQPSSVDAFNFWIKAGKYTEVEVGNIVTVQEDDSNVYGMVTEMKSYTDVDSAMIDYISHEFGDPEALTPTLRQCVHIATCEVIGASKPRVRPVSNGVVRFATSEEILEAYGMDQIKDPVFVGVIPNGNKTEYYAPALLSEEFIIGPEGAHVNYSGASGLATKTSAAVFLIRSILSRAKKAKKKIAVVGFNVKERDLLYLEQFSGEGLSELIREYGNNNERKTFELLERYNVSLEFEPKTIKYFAPGRPYDPDTPHSLRSNKVESFYWSLESVKNEQVPIRLADMLDPDDLDERAIGVLTTIQEKLESEWSTVEHFRSLINTMPSGYKNWEDHNGHTVAKVKRLININTSEILRGLFCYDDAKEKDLPVNQIKAGECYVIDIQTLNDKGKRIVFYNVLKRLSDMLESYKAKRDQDQEVPVDAVIVFVDELNKFAPQGKSFGHGLKEQIIEIAARGRSVGLILFGAEQFASVIDKEVYGNCSTHFVGRTEFVELSDKAYRWISKDLSYIASTLPKGSLLGKHALFPRPILLRFPRPFHTYKKEDIESLLKKRSGPKKQVVKSDSKDEFSNFKELVNQSKVKSEGIVKIFRKAQIARQVGVGEQKFLRWFKFWMSNRKFQGNDKNERKAFELLVMHLKKFFQE